MTNDLLHRPSDLHRLLSPPVGVLNAHSSLQLNPLKHKHVLKSPESSPQNDRILCVFPNDTLTFEYPGLYLSCFRSLWCGVRPHFSETSLSLLREARYSYCYEFDKSTSVSVCVERGIVCL